MLVMMAVVEKKGMTVDDGICEEGSGYLCITWTTAVVGIGFNKMYCVLTRAAWLAAWSALSSWEGCGQSGLRNGVRGVAGLLLLHDTSGVDAVEATGWDGMARELYQCGRGYGLRVMIWARLVGGRRRRAGELMLDSGLPCMLGANRLRD